MTEDALHALCHGALPSIASFVEAGLFVLGAVLLAWLRGKHQVGTAEVSALEVELETLREAARTGLKTPGTVKKARAVDRAARRMGVFNHPGPKKLDELVERAALKHRG